MLLTATLCWLALVGGQVAPEEPRNPDAPGDLKADQLYPDVYLNDSLEAADALARTEQLTAQGRWAEAARLLQEVSDAAADKLTRQAPGYYVGTRRRINEVIASWPAKGLQAYRSRYERPAAEAFEAALDGRDLLELTRIFERFFCTTAAGAAADTIGQLALEAGALAQAQRIYDYTARLHPNRSRFAERYQALAVLAGALKGEPPPTPLNVGAVKLRWMGRQRTLTQILAELKPDLTLPAGDPSPDDWPLAGGDPARNRAASCQVDEPGLLWRTAAFESALPNADELEFDSTLFTSDTGQRLALQPVVSQGLAFVQHRREIVALELATGKPTWRYRADRAGLLPPDEFDTQVPRWYAVTVADGRVYATLPGTLGYFPEYETPSQVAELVCLRAHAGSMLWHVTPADLGLETQELSFDSSPLVVHGQVYVVVRRRRSFGFEDCYLYSFDARTGALIFHTHLGGGSVGTFGARRPTHSTATYLDDTIFVCTNLGTVAALSALTGDVRWLRLYQRTPDDAIPRSGRTGRSYKSWDYNPVLATTQRLVCLPLDGDHILVLYPGDGQELLKVPAAELGEVRTLVAVRENLLFTAGASAACFDLSRREVVWQEPIPGDSELAGRSVLAADRMLVPTLTGLSSFNLSNGTRQDHAWQSTEPGGNLVGLPEQLLVAGPASLSVYVRKTDLYHNLHARMEQAQGDPLPALELAEVALRGREFTEVLDALSEAHRRMNKPATPPPTELAERMFADSLQLARALDQRAQLTPAVLDTLFGYVAASASTAEAHVRYRLELAELFARLGEPERSLRLCQQILRDRSLRALAAPDSAPGFLTAGMAADARITELLAQQGRTLYQPYEEEAQQLLRSATAGKAAELYARVVETFPHSQAASTALLRRAQELGQQHRFAEAARDFANLYRRLKQGLPPPRPAVSQPQLLRCIAGAHVRAQQPEHAYRWLTRAAGQHPQHRFETDAGLVTFLQCRDQLGDIRTRFEPSYPTITLPLSTQFRRDFEGPVELLLPRFDAEPTCRWSHYFVYQHSLIRAFAATTGEEIWPEPAAVRTNAQLLSATKQVAVFTTSHEVFAVELSSGRRLWSHGQYPVEFGDAEADWESQDALRTYALRRDRLITVRDSGLMACISLADGHLLWSTQCEPTPADHVRFSDRWVVYPALQGGQLTDPRSPLSASVLYVLDAATGAPAGFFALGVEEAVEQLFVTLDELALVVTSQTVTAYDIPTRSRRWQRTTRSHFTPASLRLTPDALYVSPDGQRIEKISLEDGHPLCTSAELSLRGSGVLDVFVHESGAFVGTARRVHGLDAQTCATLWEGLGPDEPNFENVFMTPPYALAVHVPARNTDEPATAFFYDCAAGSGRISPDGGTCDLGQLRDLRAILAADNALIIQAGSSILGWAHPTTER